MPRNVRVALAGALIVAISVTPRVLGAAGLLPQPLLLLGWSDVLATWNDSRLPGHKLPFVDVPFAYPPVVGYIAGVISLLSGNFLAYSILWGLVIATAAAAGGYALARHSGSRRAILYWACAPQMLLLSGINFDVLPAVLMGFAVIAARSGRDIRVATLVAIATATKLFPIVALPLQIIRVASSRHPRHAIAVGASFVGFLAVIYLPASLAPFPTIRFVGAYAVGVVANIDSPWVLAERIITAFGIDGHLAVLAMTYAGFALTYLMLVIPRARAARDPAVGFALATVTLLLWSRLYSPQYSLWLLPFFVLLPLRVRSFALLTAADIGVFFTIYPLTLIREWSDPLRAAMLAVLTACVALRVVALIVIWRDVARVGSVPADGAVVTIGRSQGKHVRG